METVSHPYESDAGQTASLGVFYYSPVFCINFSSFEPHDMLHSSGPTVTYVHVALAFLLYNMCM